MHGERVHVRTLDDVGQFVEAIHRFGRRTESHEIVHDARLEVPQTVRSYNAGHVGEELPSLTELAACREEPGAGGSRVDHEVAIGLVHASARSSATVASAMSPSSRWPWATPTQAHTSAAC